jgi:non-homologous end joining protein Ku
MHTIEIEKFVPKAGIDQLYWEVSYHLLPNGKTGVELLRRSARPCRRTG